MKIQQKKTDAPQLPQTSAERTEKSSLKTQLRGMGYDDAVQMLAPEGAPKGADAPTGSSRLEFVKTAGVEVISAWASFFATYRTLEHKKNGAVHPKSRAALATAIETFKGRAGAAVEAAIAGVAGAPARDKDPFDRQDVDYCMGFLNQLKAMVPRLAESLATGGGAEQSKYLQQTVEYCVSEAETAAGENTLLVVRHSQEIKATWTATMDSVLPKE